VFETLARAAADWQMRAALVHADLPGLLVRRVPLLLDGGLPQCRLILTRWQLAASLDHALQHAALLDELALLYGERTPGHAPLPTHHHEGPTWRAGPNKLLI
jgi:hypothetical protein